LIPVDLGGTSLAAARVSPEHAGRLIDARGFRFTDPSGNRIDYLFAPHFDDSDGNGEPGYQGPVTINRGNLSPLTIDVGAGFSTKDEPAAVTFGTNGLEIARLQHRLNYLGFAGILTITDGATKKTTRLRTPLPIDGNVSNDANSRDVDQWAIGLFNAAVDAGQHSRSSTLTSSAMAMINARNAPRWMEAGQLNDQFGNWKNIDVDDHDWGTSWAMEVLRAAGVASDVPLDVNDLSLALGGNTPSHASHESGMDIDLETAASNDGSTPFYSTHDVVVGTLAVHNNGDQRSAVLSVVSNDSMTGIGAGDWIKLGDKYLEISTTNALLRTVTIKH